MRRMSARRPDVHQVYVFTRIRNMKTNTVLFSIIGILFVAIAVYGGRALTAPANTDTAAATVPAATTPAPQAPTATPAVTQPSTTAPTPTSATPSFTMAQIATHNSASSCYAAVNGSVYDLTSFINRHPGGAARILTLCGTDGTAAFEGQHGGQRRPANELAGLKIGTLAQ